MTSRYGLMVAVGILFAGVILAGTTRHMTMASMCKEYQALSEQMKAAASESVDQRMGALATLSYIQRLHCD